MGTKRDVAPCYGIGGVLVTSTCQFEASDGPTPPSSPWHGELEIVATEISRMVVVVYQSLIVVPVRVDLTE